MAWGAIGIRNQGGKVLKGCRVCHGNMELATACRSSVKLRNFVEFIKKKKEAT